VVHRTNDGVQVDRRKDELVELLQLVPEPSARESHLMREAIRGNRRSSEVLRGPQRSSKVISGLSVVYRANVRGVHIHTLSCAFGSKGVQAGLRAGAPHEDGHRDLRPQGH